MGIKTEIIKKHDYNEVWAFDDKDPKNKQKVYKIYLRKSKIDFFPKSSYFSVRVVYIEGFSEIPEEFSPKGYIKHGIDYYLNKKLEEKKINKVTISKDKKSSLIKRKSIIHLTINYASFKKLKEIFGKIKYDFQDEKNNSINEFFYNILPKEFKKEEISAKQRCKRVIKNLDENIIEHFSKDDVQILLEFFQKFIERKYKDRSHKHELLKKAKIKVDTIAISQIIKDFEKMLREKSNENLWGTYLCKNLFLINSKYIHPIPELNLVLGGERKVDFGLVDFQGYLDIFEIKTPDTKLLAAKQDRGNYYWSTEAIKAIAQAEKYLHHALSKASVLEGDIKRQKKISVKVIKPQAILIIGSSSELNDDEKKEDFKILRSSLKNIEIILYDELLEAIKLQQGKVYIE